MSIALKDFVNKFLPKERAYKILKNKANEFEKEIILIWKEAFVLLVPSTNKEEEEEEGRGEERLEGQDEEE